MKNYNESLAEGEIKLKCWCVCDGICPDATLWMNPW